MSEMKIPTWFVHSPAGVHPFFSYREAKAYLNKLVLDRETNIFLTQTQEVYTVVLEQVPFTPVEKDGYTVDQKRALEEYYNYQAETGPTEEDPF